MVANSYQNERAVSAKKAHKINFFRTKPTQTDRNRSNPTKAIFKLELSALTLPETSTLNQKKHETKFNCILGGASQGEASRGQVSRGQVSQGQVSRGQVSRGQVSRGKAHQATQQRARVPCGGNIHFVI